MKGLRKIVPYVPGEQPTGESIIKLNTNENPYPPSPKVQSALNNFSASDLKRYNSIENSDLKEVLAKHHGLTPNHFVVGNGSDEILAFCFLAFFNSNDPILFPDLTYGFYKVWADLFQIPYKELPLDANFTINFSDYEQLNGGIIIANPNAPTGLLKSLTEISELLRKNSDVIVIVDEAYIDFSSISALALLENYPNLIITRTFSKSSSLAGLRVGYAIGDPKYINIIASIKSSFNPYSVDMIAEKLAIAAVEDVSYYETITKQICTTRDWFAEQLNAIGFQSLSSNTNFLLVTHPKLSINFLYNFLIEHQVYVRYFPTIKRLSSYLRISIGSQAEMEKVVSLIKQFNIP